MAEPRCYRCPYCERAWPVDVRYEQCPLCREETKPNYAEMPMDPEDAERHAAHFAFGWWLWDNGLV